jgi:hypothetical protein
MKSKKTIHLVLILGFLSAFTLSFGQYGGTNQVDLERSFNLDDSISLRTDALDSLITWQERVILHVDRSVLTKDTPLFFKAYILTGPNRVRATMSKVLKIELTNKEKQIVASQYHKIQDGMSVGALTVPQKLDKGTYTLRAYTRWMQNYGEPFYYMKELQYGSTETVEFKDKESTSPFSVSFHPEGGNLIANFSNRLLIKIHTREGEIGNMHGEIIDSKRNVVATAVPFGPYLMSAIFKPIPDESYMLKTNYGFSYPLPKSLSNGYLLNVSNINPSLLRIRVKATPGFTNSKVWISGKMGGITYFKKELELQKSSLEVDLQKKDIPFGVLTVSLIDAEGILWAKRPVTIHAKNDLRLEILPLVQDISKDERAFKVKVTDSKGKPVATEVSLSVVNFSNNSGIRETRNKTDFSWESYEISNGDINNNAFGFASQSRRKERFLNDIELITGVSSDNDMISQTVPNKIKYPFQQGLDLFGYAYNLNNKLLKNTKIQMLGASDADVIAQEFKTDSSGRIRLENLQLVGETELVFRTVGADPASRLVKIVPLQEDFKPESTSTSKLDFNPNRKGKIVNTSPWKPIDQDKVVELDEVEVVQRKFKEKKTQPSVYGLEPTRVKFQDVKRPQTIPQLLLGIAGVQVIGLGTLRPQLILPKAAGMGPVLWVLDGMPLMQPSGLVDIINSISYVDVERIEILFGPQAAIYGSRSSGGAIVIYTRSGAGMDYVNRKEGHLNFQGYFESPTFDSYVEHLIKRPKKYKNGIHTLFWDPKIKTDENGEATIRFNTPIEYDRLELKASAVTAKGKIGSVKVVFENQ